MVSRLVQLLAFLVLASSAWASLPGVHGGWNTSVATAAERLAAAKHFGFTVSDDESLWLHAPLTQFVGKTFQMTKIDIIKRTFVNTMMQLALKMSTVLWTVSPGPDGVAGDLIEHINGIKTGVTRYVGWASPTTALGYVQKEVMGHNVVNDWGVFQVRSVSDTTIETDFNSEGMGEFVMTWILKDDVEKEGIVVV